MNILDVCIVLIAIIMAYRGFRVGLVQQLFSGAGFVIGLLVGVWVSPYLPLSSFNPAQRMLLTMLVIISISSIFLLLCEYISLFLRRYLQGKIVRKIDGTLGSFASVVMLLVVLWLSTPLLLRLPNHTLAGQVRGSAIAASLRNSIPDAPSFIAQLGQAIDPSRFPQVFTGSEPIIDSDKPLPDLGSLNTAVERARVSTVRIEGLGCGGVVEGSGFVARDGYVITNAHVVAGVDKPTVSDTAGRHAATVVWFDENLDIAVLRTSGLAGTPLTIQNTKASAGTAAVALGYPGGGGLTVSPAVVLDAFTARGRNIYDSRTIDREVYSLKADIRSGNSGGPLVNEVGEVIGVMFAASTEYNQVGYALTMPAVSTALQSAIDHPPVNTKECTQE